MSHWRSTPARPAKLCYGSSRSDLDARAERQFDGQFLGIANPWTDDRLMHWTGYTQLRYFDSDNHPAPPDTPGARAEEMIPLALYNLDYPRVPLLLADFRDSLSPKRREMVQPGRQQPDHRRVWHHALRQSVVLRGGPRRLLSCARGTAMR